MNAESTTAGRVEPSTSGVDVQAAEIETPDRVRISGRFYQSAAANVFTPVLICPATGVPQRFYAAFATWLAEEGFDVLTIDYRGIGSSLRESHVKQCRARKQDWGQLDMPAGVDWLRQRCGSERVNLVGHSAGGQLVGLMPNHAALRRVVMVSSSTGYVGRIEFPTRVFAYFFLRLYLPLTASLLGYAPTKRIGMGENLPADVARQWARWCLRPGYVENGFGREIERHSYDEFEAPILSLYASDDRIASEANVRDLLRLFPKAPAETRRLDPASFDCEQMGHVGFFRSSARGAWPIVRAFLRDA